MPKGTVLEHGHGGERAASAGGEAAETGSAGSRRGAATHVSLLAHELRVQQLLFWRNREAAVFVFVFPPMLFLLLGSVYDGEIDGEPAAAVLLVGILGYGCANTALAGLAIQLVVRRESGLLKRVRATPLPPATYLSGVLGSTVVVFALQMALTVVLGVLLFDLQGAASWTALAIVLLLGAAAFAGLGFGAASLIRSDEGVSAAVNLIVLPMAFLSGSFGSTSDYPEALRALSDVLPLTYLIRLVKAAYLHGEYPTEDLAAVAVLVAWGVVGYAVAVKRFGWQPREK